jgi:hypothetical protein
MQPFVQATQKMFGQGKIYLILSTTVPQFTRLWTSFLRYVTPHVQHLEYIQTTFEVVIEAEEYTQESKNTFLF